jgi:peptide/nickel transport system ATP-binding protein
MTLLSVEGLHVRYAVPGGELRALDGVSLTVQAGETVGLVGESGCGKSSLGRAILRLVPTAEGTITFDGINIAQLGGRAMKPFRRRIQMVFQDPYASLNARHTVLKALTRPLLVHGVRPRAERRRRAEALLETVGLWPEILSRTPNEFSGGQRQRIAIARALVLQPELIVFDEPVSALDVSIQAQILNLLVALKTNTGLAYLFISHDLSVVRFIADRVYVMYLGRMVEMADPRSLWESPRHHYTRALIDSVPRRVAGRPAATVRGDVPSPRQPPSGCTFHPRCPAATARCAQEAPILRQVSQSQMVACHHPI